MVGHRCPECFALRAEMHSAVDDAKRIIQEAGVLIRANKPSEHIDGWQQARERWESARQRWMLASADFKIHVATHHGTPISVANVMCR